MYLATNDAHWPDRPTGLYGLGFGVLMEPGTMSTAWDALKKHPKEQTSGTGSFLKYLY